MGNNQKLINLLYDSTIYKLVPPSDGSRNDYDMRGVRDDNLDDLISTGDLEKHLLLIDCEGDVILIPEELQNEKVVMSIMNDFADID